jgi:hypothetical protein
MQAPSPGNRAAAGTLAPWRHLAGHREPTPRIVRNANADIAVPGSALTVASTAERRGES